MTNFMKHSSMPVVDSGLAAPLLRKLPSRVLGRAAAIVSKIAGEALDCMGSNRHRFATLATLEAFGPSSQADLGRRTGLDRSDVTAVVTDLIGQGYVDRAIDPANRRRNVVSLTDAGAAAFAEQSDALSHAQDWALRSLTALERAELIRLLRLLSNETA